MVIRAEGIGEIKEVLLDDQNEIRKFYSVNWIPVSERMPKCGEAVLFCDYENYIVVGRAFVDYFGNIAYMDFSGEYTWELYDVKAWMPLPEPYKEE